MEKGHRPRHTGGPALEKFNAYGKGMETSSEAPDLNRYKGSGAVRPDPRLSAEGSPGGEGA